MSIKLEQYKIFNEAATTLSFSIASRNLFISQSAVSQAIITLEKELNTKLFIRKSKGVLLTKEGKLLYQHINQALNLITTAENHITNMQTLEEGQLVIASGDTICAHYLTDYLEKFHQLFPKVHIKIINRTTIETVDLLKSNQVDLGFINLPVFEESLVSKPCLEVHDIFVSNDPLHLDKTYDYEEISKLPLILLERSANSRRIIDKLFANNGITLKPEIETGSHDLLLQFAQIRLGVSCVIKEFSSMYLNHKLLQEIKLKTPIASRHIGFAYPKRIAPNAATNAFIKMIEEDINH